MARKGYLSKTLTLPDGTRKYIYGKTKEELDQKVLEAQLQLRMGVDLKNHDTFGEFTQMWYNATKKGQIAPSSEVITKSRINNHLMPILAGMKLKKITPMNCQQVFTEMADNGMAEGTIRCIYQLLNEILDSAVDNGLIARNPAKSKSVRRGGRKTEKRIALTPAQVQTMFENIEKSSMTYRTKALAHDLAVVALGTGLRIGELLGLQWDCVDLESCEVEVRRNLVSVNGEYSLNDHTKTSSGIRTVPFSDDVKEAFLRLLADKNGDFVFHNKKGGHILFQTSYRWFVGKAGEGVQCSHHTFRHTCITNWFDVGLDVKEVQYLAGHADPTITMKIYVDYSKEKRYADTKSKVRAMCTTKCTTSVPHDKKTIRTDESPKLFLVV